MKYVFALICAAALLAGCTSAASTSQAVRSYTFAYDAPVWQGDKVPMVLAVARFEAAPAMQNNQIVYREQPHEVMKYYYHHWQGRPADMVAAFLTRDLRASGAFSGVFSDGTGVSSPYLVTGIVEEMAEVDRPNGWFGALKITVSLVNRHEADLSKQVLLQETFSKEVPTDRQHPEAVVRALGDAMAQISKEVTAAFVAVLNMQMNKADVDRRLLEKATLSNLGKGAP